MRQRKYDWNKWFRKNRFVIGTKDYTCTPEIMRQQLRNAACVRGQRVKTEIADDGEIVVEVVEHG